MKKKTKYIIGIALIVALAIVLIVSLLLTREDKDALYIVSARQWQEALGDEAHIQTICRNVTIEMHTNGAESKMLLATVNGSLLLDSETDKHICISSPNGFITYTYDYDNQKWQKLDGKTDVVDISLNTYLPDLVDMAMSGLLDEFENAAFDADKMCYVITKTTDSEGETIHSRVYFENGQLVRLETDIVSQDTTQTLELYNIGKTTVEAPVEYQNG